MDTSRDQDFVGLSALARQGINPVTLRRRLRAERVDIFTDPFDRRRRLIRREDADRLLKPRLIEAAPGKGIAA